MKKLLFILILGCLGSLYSYGQQDPQFSMYMFNGLYINPAYAGSKEVADVTGLYRRQWAGINGAPHTGSIAFHSPLKRTQYALGAIMTFDRIGVTDQYNVNLVYAYRARINESIKISFGVQGTYTHYSADLTEVPLPDPNQEDPNFMEDLSLNHLNFGAGIYLYGRKFYLGAAAPHLLNNSLKESLSSEGTADVARQYRHYLFTAGYVFGKPLAAIKFKPSILIKYVQNAPVDFDFNASLLFVDRLWIGASYRLGGDSDNSRGDAIVGMIEFRATPHLRFGYAYDHTLSQLNNFTSGSHEIMIGYDFGFDKSRFVHPRYVKYF